MSEVDTSKTQTGTSTAWQVIGRLVASAVVLAITALLILRIFCCFINITHILLLYKN